MTNAEIIAYEYGRRLMAECQRVITEGQVKQVPEEAKLGPTEITALNRLGQEGWMTWVQKGAATVR